MVAVGSDRSSVVGTVCRSCWRRRAPGRQIQRANHWPYCPGDNASIPHDRYGHHHLCCEVTVNLQIPFLLDRIIRASCYLLSYCLPSQSDIWATYKRAFLIQLNFSLKCPIWTLKFLISLFVCSVPLFPIISKALSILQGTLIYLVFFVMFECSGSLRSSFFPLLNNKNITEVC